MSGLIDGKTESGKVLPKKKLKKQQENLIPFFLLFIFLSTKETQKISTYDIVFLAKKVTQKRKENSNPRKI